jgi:hypothetical protein
VPILEARRVSNLGLVERIGGTYRYYLSRLRWLRDRSWCHITENVLIPALS